MPLEERMLPHHDLDAQVAARRTPLAGMALSPDGKYVVTLDAPLGRLGLWDAHTGKPVTTFADLPAKAGAAAFTPDSKMLAIAVSGREFHVLEMADPKKRVDRTISDLDDDHGVAAAAVDRIG